MESKNRRGLFYIVMVCVMLCGFGVPTWGRMLDLEPHPPEISSDCTDISYNASTDGFSVWGIPYEINAGGSVGTMSISADGYEEFILDAVIDGSGALVAGGTIEITGTVASPLDYDSETLLIGTLTEFSAFYDSQNPTGGWFEFCFEVTGGDAQELYGLHGGVILYMGPNNNGYNGTFGSNFDNFGSEGWGDGQSTTTSLPEPGMLSLLAIGLAAIRLRKNK